jgi:hypothetical protein
MEENMARAYQVLFYDLMLVLYTILTFCQISKQIYISDKKKLGEIKKEEDKKKHEELDRKIKRFNVNYKLLF